MRVKWTAQRSAINQKLCRVVNLDVQFQGLKLALGGRKRGVRLTI